MAVEKAISVPKTSKNTRLPVQYIAAVKALKECQNIDEASTFMDAAEALAAWARIYRHNEAGKQARQLKLHAFRRMGELALDMAPPRGRKGGGRAPGAVAVLKDHGLSRHHADAANHLAKMGASDFESIVDQDRPPAPTSVAKRLRQPGELTPWQIIKQGQRTPFSGFVFIQRNTPGKIASTIKGNDAHIATREAEQIIRWLQSFIRELQP